VYAWSGQQVAVVVAVAVAVAVAAAVVAVAAAVVVPEVRVGVCFYRSRLAHPSGRPSSSKRRVRPLWGGPCLVHDQLTSVGAACLSSVAAFLGLDVRRAQVTRPQPLDTMEVGLAWCIV
jgi:hypothetical protein